MPKISILILLLELYVQGIGLEVGILTGENININNKIMGSEIKNLLFISSLISLILGTLPSELGNHNFGV